MYGWRPRSTPAQRRAQASRHAAQSRKSGVALSPVVIEGRTIARSFWGKAWCDAMESYGDYANRLPRGRTYVRNGSVVDLRVEPGLVSATVSGSTLYRTTVRVSPLAPVRWRAVVDEHAGQVSSLVDLLQGKLPASLLNALCDRSSGLFPGPTELEFQCSCPDWASMCKHVAAVLYGVGARLDQDPGLFFVLRGVDATDLAVRGAALGFSGGAGEDDLAGVDLGSLFGIDLAGEGASPASAAPAKPAAPAEPAEPTKPAAKPAKPSAPPKAAALPKAAAPAEPTAPPKAAALPKAAGPAKLAAPAKPSAKPAKPAAPAKSAAPAKPAAEPVKPAAPAKAAKRRTADRAPVQMVTMTAAELDELRIDGETVGAWLRSGVLLPTGDPNVYQPTAETGPHLRAYIAAHRR